MTEKKKRYRPNQPFRMKRCFHDVESTNLKRVYWSMKYKTLVVQFQSEKYWFYPDVSQSLYWRLMKATSKGSYFATEIRDTHAGYPFEYNDVVVGMGEKELLKQLEASIHMINERRNKAS